MKEYAKLAYPAELKEKIKEFLKQSVDIKTIKDKIESESSFIHGVSRHDFMDSTDLRRVTDAVDEIGRLCKVYNSNRLYETNTDLVKITITDLIKDLKDFWVGKYIYTPCACATAEHSGFYARVDNLSVSKEYHSTPVVRGEGPFFFRNYCKEYDTTKGLQYNFQFFANHGIGISISPEITHTFELTQDEFQEELNEMSKQAVNFLTR